MASISLRAVRSMSFSLAMPTLRASTALHSAVCSHSRRDFNPSLSASWTSACFCWILASFSARAAKCPLRMVSKTKEVYAESWGWASRSLAAMASDCYLRLSVSSSAASLSCFARSLARVTSLTLDSFAASRRAPIERFSLLRADSRTIV